VAPPEPFFSWCSLPLKQTMRPSIHTDFLIVLANYHRADDDLSLLHTQAMAPDLRRKVDANRALRLARENAAKQQLDAQVSSLMPHIDPAIDTHLPSLLVHNRQNIPIPTMPNQYGLILRSDGHRPQYNHLRPLAWLSHIPGRKTFLLARFFRSSPRRNVSPSP
jgi:hypothetical protein